MHWTKDTPTQPGTYWAKDVQIDEPRLVEIRDVEGHGLSALFHGFGLPVPLEKFELWCGPLQLAPPHGWAAVLEGRCPEYILTMTMQMKEGVGGRQLAYGMKWTVDGEEPPRGLDTMWLWHAAAVLLTQLGKQDPQSTMDALSALAIRENWPARGAGGDPKS